MKIKYWAILVSVCIILCGCSQNNEEIGSTMVSTTEKAMIEETADQTATDDTTTAETQNTTEEFSEQAPDATAFGTTPTLPTPPSQETIEPTSSTATEPFTQPTAITTTVPEESHSPTTPEPIITEPEEELTFATVAPNPVTLPEDIW